MKIWVSLRPFSHLMPGLSAVWCLVPVSQFPCGPGPTSKRCLVAFLAPSPVWFPNPFPVPLAVWFPDLWAVWVLAGKCAVSAPAAMIHGLASGLVGHLVPVSVPGPVGHLFPSCRPCESRRVPVWSTSVPAPDASGSWSRLLSGSRSRTWAAGDTRLHSRARSPAPS